MSVPQRIPPETPAATDSEPAVLAHPNGWLVLVGLGLGLTTWAAFLYIGLRARRRAWLAWAVVYAALLVVFGVLDGSANPGSDASGVAALVLLGAWVGGTTHAAVVRNDAARTRRPGGAARLEAARRRIDRRAEGRRLAAKDPRLAREAGVGRPDVPGSDDHGLVDVNHASKEALCRLPGITPEMAQRIADTRAGVGFFRSAEDLGITLDLSPQLVDDIQEYAVFL